MPSEPPERPKGDPRPVSDLTKLGALLVWMKLYRYYRLVFKRKLGLIAPRRPPEDDVQ